MPDKDKKQDPKAPKAPKLDKKDDFAPQLVKEIPKGAVNTGRKNEKGKDIWEIRTKHEEATKPSKSPGTPVKPKLGIKPSSGTPTNPKKKNPESTFGETVESFVMDEPLPPPPTPKDTRLYGEVQTYAKALPKASANQTWDTYEFADPTGNATNKALKAHFENGKEITFDANGNKVFTGKTLQNFRDQSIQQIETPQMSGVNKTNTLDNSTFSQPGVVFTKNANSGGMGVNKATLGYDLKGAKDSYIPKKYDALGKEIPQVNPNPQSLINQQPPKEVGKMYDKPVDSNRRLLEIKSTFSKGGVVGKIKGYSVGGGVYNEFSNINNLDSGVVGQNDPYAAQKQADAQKQDNEEQKKLRQQQARGVANAVGQGMGGIGSAYYNSQPTDNKSEATRSAGLAAVSQMGPVGGMIGGVAAMGDKIGKPIKNRSEKLDSSGNLVDANKSKQNAIIGSLLSPTKALAYRSESGNWGDVTGDKYNKFIEDKAKAQINEVKAANIKSRQQQAVLNRDNNDFNATTSDPYNLKGATFDENKNLVLANGQQFDKNRPMMNKGGLVQKLANGGKIVGKGGPKDDKILAKVKPNSFVVPEENKEIAEEIRETYLDKSPKEKANLNQKGGIAVKLSNGEHLYTPEEKKELLRQGVDVNVLAPNADNKEEEKIEKRSHIMFPKLKNGGDVPKGTRVGNATWNGKNWVSDNGSVYTTEKGKSFESVYLSNVEKAKANEATRKGSELNVYKRKLNEAKQSGNDTEAQRLQAKVDELSGIKSGVDNNMKEGTEASTTASSTSPSKKMLKPTSSKPKDLSLAMPTKDIATSGLEEDILAKQNELEKSQNASIMAAPDRVAADQKRQQEEIDVKKTQAKAVKKQGLLSRIGDVDPTAFVGIGQSALGLNMLGKEKRPIYNAVLAQTYNADVNRAQRDASFGLTPEQKFAAEQDIENARRDATFAGLNASGGSGVQAYNTAQSAANEAWKAKLGLKTADTELRMQKQQYADQQAAGRADVIAANRRQAFTDAMGAFQQKQQAGSELIGAGLANTIGAYRFKQDQEARRKADEARGYSLNNYGQTNS